MSDGRIGGWLQTHSGGQFWPLDPRVEEVRIQDIAAALSKLCRFAGHCLDFYSVAQHSVLVSRFVPREYAFEALLHDGSEAFMVDVPRPLKLALPDYRGLERRVQDVIYQRFGVEETANSANFVKAADNRVLAQEHRDLMAMSPYNWSAELERLAPLPYTIVPLDPEKARLIFLERFRQLAPRDVYQEATAPWRS
jgi:5'-deoxynucleotidase YfbR-like HD superfamily hydrolase